jgi:hypothetical protein
MGRDIAAMGRRGIQIKFWWETQRKRDHYEVQDVGGYITIKLTLER